MTRPPKMIAILFESFHEIEKQWETTTPYSKGDAIIGPVPTEANLVIPLRDFVLDINDLQMDS